MPTGAPPDSPEDGSDQEVSKPDYWNAIYLENESPGWNIGQPAPALIHWLENAGAKPGRVCVPGCGYGHDVRLLAEHGFDAVGVDFAPLAVARANEHSIGAPGKFEFRQADVFELTKTEHEQFDYFYEYTCFVALEPSRRAEYVQLALSVLKPGGLLIGCFYNHGREGGPPFDVTREEVLALYEPHFEIRTLEVTPHSIERRAGHELWAEFAKPT
ncbi:MAG: methyltransferase domain-containing protein [Planctomycetes bacterium]|nr:methyltransferase domain-containing protein [Planctomycetota bacterium]